MNNNFVNDKELYNVQLKDNIYYFEDLSNNKKISFKKRKLIDEETFSYDILRIDESLSYKFIDFIIKSLLNNKDLLLIELLFRNEEIIDLIHNNNLKVSNYNYVIPFKPYDVDKSYILDDYLDDKSKSYFLEHINNESMVNQKYFNPKGECNLITDKWFSNEEFQFLTYRKNNEIVGVVDFKIFDEYDVNDDIYDYSNSICIRSIFSDSLDTLEMMLKLLMQKYEKKIYITYLYTNEILNNAILNCGGILKYISIINRDNIR